MKQDKINPYFQELQVDYLYHFGIDSSMDLKAIFGNVDFVVMTQDDDGAAIIAHKFAKLWYQIQENDFEFKPIFKTERFHLYKIGPVLVVSYGIGMPSMLISLNELAKLLFHTNNQTAQFFKVGTCESLSLDLGSIVITKSAINSRCEALHYSIECGEEYSSPTNLDSDLIEDVTRFTQQYLKYDLTIANTLGSWDAFEESGRIDGFLPLNYTIEERNQYIKQVLAVGVNSIDMESLEFAAFGNNAGIKACIINVVVTKLMNDSESYDDLSQVTVFDLVTKYFIYKLNKALLGDSCYENK